MFSRIALFLATNFAVLVLAGIIMSLLGVQSDQLGGLLVIGALFGFGGSLVSLLTSKWMAKRATRAHVITEPRNDTERWLLATVQRQAQAAGIGMPEVAVYDAPEINAFATGANRNKALVAVYTGLLRQMQADEAEAVLGHEVAHVANGDMVTMALLQGVLNTFVLVLARLPGRGSLRRAADEPGGADHRLLHPAAQLRPSQAKQRLQAGRMSMLPEISRSMLKNALVLGLFATMIAMWFSRRREFRADDGGARLAGRQKMIAALERLAGNQGQSTLPAQVEAFGIAGGIGQGMRKLFMSHPPLAERIAALRAAG